MTSSDILKLCVPALLTFATGMSITPFVTKFLYDKKLWKKSSVKKTLDGATATISQSLHNDEARKTPRMGGVVVWGSVLLVSFFLFGVAVLSGNEMLYGLSFLSKNQTAVPLLVLLFFSCFGLIDDYLVCRDQGSYLGGGLSLRSRLLSIAAVGLFLGYWFYYRLDIVSVWLPWGDVLYFGFGIIPLVILFLLGTYAGGIIDGIDGLAGGVFSVFYSAFAIIAIYNNQNDIAAFCMAVVGGLLVFLWFNIPPARFFLSETGTMGLTTTLVVIAFLTDSVFVFPIIILPLIITALSSVLQILSKKVRNGKKLFIVAPLHNHFQAMGWPGYKVTMRYWVVSVVFALIGILIFISG